MSVLLSIATLEFGGLPLILWTGKIYGTLKATLGIIALIFSAYALTPQGKSFCLHRLPLSKHVRWPKIALLSFGFLAALILILKTAQYLALQGTLDTTFNLSSAWNTGRTGLLLDPVQGMGTQFEEHFRPLLMLYSPIAWLSKSPLLVIICHTALVLSALPALWILSRRIKIPPHTRFFLCVLLATNTFYQECLTMLFIPETMALPIFFTVLIAWEKHDYRLLAFSTLLLLGVKEEAGLALAAFGIAAAVEKKRRREAALLSAIGIATLIATLYFIAHFQTEWSAIKWGLIHPGGTSSSFLSSLLSHPSIVLTQWAWPPSRFLPFIFLILSTGGSILAFPPALLGLLILNAPHQMVLERLNGYHTLLYYHAAFLLPLLFWGSARGLDRLWTRYPNQHNRILALMSITATMTLLSSGNYVQAFKMSGQKYRAAWTVIEKIQPEEAVWAQASFAPPLAFRRKIKVFWDIDHPSLHKGYFLPDAVILSESYIRSLPKTKAHGAMQFFKNAGFQRIAQEKGVYLLRRNSPRTALQRQPTRRSSP